MTTIKQRRELADVMDWLVDESAQIHYAERRPMSTAHIGNIAELERAVRSPAGITMDCSESVTLLCHVVGLRDPNGRNYDGEGYTGTLLDYLPHYNEPINGDLGALVVFGPGTGQHVCMVRKHGKNPLLFSHGNEAGPYFISLESERQYHSPPVRFLSIVKL